MMESAAVTDVCKVCLGQCDPYENPSVRCEGVCKRRIHTRCLKRGTLPGNLMGDVFFDVHCVGCSEMNEELIVRQKLPWLTTVILTLYNLREKSNGISRRGYFHWKSDISTFINTNWDQMFSKVIKRKKNWIGTISGTLSHYSGVFFKSGTSELGDQGWWKLIDNDPPEVLVEKYYRVLELKKQQQAKLKAKNLDSPKSVISNEDENSSGAESMKLRQVNFVKPENETVNSMETENHTVKMESENEIVNETVFTNEVPKIDPICEEFGDFLDLDLDLPNIEVDFPSFNIAANTIVEESPFQGCNQLPDMFVSDCFQDVPEVVVQEASEDVNVSDVPMLENEFDETLKLESVTEKLNDEPMESNNNDESNNENNEKSDDLPPPFPTKFKQSPKKPWPWDESFKLDFDSVRPMMSEREEEFLLQKMEQYKHLLDTAPPDVRRIYRKLAVRKLKRQYGLPILNIDTFDGKPTVIKKKGNTFLDRFISNDTSIFFEQRLQGPSEPTSVYSPYTSRLLKPFIRRDTSSRPLWLRVMTELLQKVNGKDPQWKPRPPAPIDYSYIKPQHIPAINSLCTQFFWPGVDLTECLQYPDFTCVVLYKKLVVGFAILVPDVNYNEAYISFLLVRPEWQKAGIGTFMLYHLIQTCMGKDITLHVSATNPALILYQKFGFKQEEFVQDFYDKYILPSSKESKHALFLRLSR